jgi:hypothetical protein
MIVLKPWLGSPIYISLNETGFFREVGNADTYELDLTNCTFVGCRSALPRTVTVTHDQVTTVEIDIDTGIR